MAPNMYNGMQMGMPQMGMAPMSTDYTNLSNQTQGKGKAREVDFEAAFAQLAASMAPVEMQTSRIEEVDDVSTIEEALKNASLKEGEEEGPLDFQKYVKPDSF
jgi:peroxin-5